jgi:subtilisin family serine protease
MRVGMIDSGVSQQQSGVASSRLTRRSFHGGQGQSDIDHGSAVAALLAGQGHGGIGLLPYSDLFAADVFTKTPDGRLIATATAMAQAMDWLMRQKVKVINISVAGPDNRLLRRIMETAQTQGVVIVASAGNGGARAEPAFPAAYPQAIAVTAVDARRRLYASANRGAYISLAAPGVAVFVPTAGDGAYRTGTSFAAPFVTASVAVLQAKDERLMPEQVKNALQQTASDLGARGRDPLYGWGLLRAPAKCP